MVTLDGFFRGNGFVPAQEIDRQALIGAFISEMEKGLAGEPSSLMMVPSYIGVCGRVPSGRKVVVLDAGGTNFRGGLVEIPPRVTERRNRPMPGVKEDVGIDAFYEEFAAEVRRLRPGADVARIGWCFSYPAEATPKLDAKLARWTKNIRAPGIVGQYVGEELLKRLGGGEVAIVNDTVATLLAAKATEGDREYSSYIGFILGTGTNCAYVEKRANITKLGDAALFEGGTMIVNAESGGFSRIGQSEFDKAMDAKTLQCGQNVFEKMISGAYLGGIGLEIYRAAAKVGMFSKKATSAINGLGALETMDFDNFCAGYAKEGRANPLDAAFAAPDDARMARRLGIPVFERAAVLTAVHLAAFAIKSGAGESADSPIAINADGSTYYKTRAIDFASAVKKELDSLLVPRNIHYEITPLVDDAPMIGAAIAALIGEKV